MMRKERFFCFILIFTLVFSTMSNFSVIAEGETVDSAVVLAEEKSAKATEAPKETSAPTKDATEGASEADTASDALPKASEAEQTAEMSKATNVPETEAIAEASVTAQPTEVPMVSDAPLTDEEKVTEASVATVTPDGGEQAGAAAETDAQEMPEATEAPEERFSKGYALLKAGTKVYSDEHCATLLGELDEKTVVYVLARQETDNEQRDILRFAYAEDGEAHSAYVRAGAAEPLTEAESAVVSAKQSEVYYRNDRDVPLFVLPLKADETETEIDAPTATPETIVDVMGEIEAQSSADNTEATTPTVTPEATIDEICDGEVNPNADSTDTSAPTSTPEAAINGTSESEANPSEDDTEASTPTVTPASTEQPETTEDKTSKETTDTESVEPAPIEEEIPVIDENEVPTIDENFVPTEIDIPDEEALTEEEQAAANDIPKVQSITILVDGQEAGSSVTLDRAESDCYLLTADVFPVDAACDVKWSVSSTSYATIDEDGWLTLKKSGSFTVTCKALDGSNKTKTLRVKAVNLVKEIFLSGAEEMRSGGTVQLSVELFPTDATNKDLVWTSSDETIVTVDSKGKVTAKTVTEPISVEITAATENGEIESSPHDILVCPPVQSVEIQIGGAICEKETLDLAYEKPELALSAAVFPEDAIQRVTWSSSDKKVATVDEEGIVTAHAAGTATITATAADGSKKSASMKLTVLYSVTDIMLTAPSDVVAGGKSMQIAAEVLPEGAANKKLTWTTSDKTVATVSSSGKVTAKKVTEPKTVTITATAADGMGASDSITLTVRPVAKSISLFSEDGMLLPSTKTIAFEEDGQTVKLQAQVLPTNAGQSVKWKSSNEKIAYVDEQTGVVTLHKAGNVTITATAADGSGVKKTVKLQGVTLVSSISISSLSELAGGCSTTAKASVSPADATNKKVYWYTDDTEYITINKTSGKIRASKVSETETVTIYAVAQDGSGKRDELSFTVTPAIQKMSIVKDGKAITALTLDAADENENMAQLGVSFTPDTACPSGSVIWKSSNAKIATVDESGKVTAVKNGTVTLNATALDGSKKSTTVRLTVKTKVQEINTNATYYVGLKKTVSLNASVSPSTASDKKLTYTSMDKTIASVTSSGRVTGKGEGETEIVIATKDGRVQKTVTVIVLPADTSISILDEDQSKANGKTISLKLMSDNAGSIIETYYTLTTSILPLNACAEVAWSVSPAGVVSLDAQDNGTCVLRLLKGGTATVTAKTVDGSNKSAKVKIRVTKPVTSLTIEGPTELAKGKSTYLTAQITPTDATNQAVTWESLSPDIVSVDQKGKITAKANSGEAIIVATAKDGSEVTNIITVTVMPKAESIALYYVAVPANTEEIGSDTYEPKPAEGRVTVVANDIATVYLRAVVSPDAASQKVTVTSSVPSVATVFPMDDESGYYAASIQLYKRGTTVITVNTADGTKIKKSFTLEVRQNAESIEISGDTYLVSKQSAQLKAAVYPSTASSKTVTWGFEEGDTDYSAYASITAKGVITAKTVIEPTEIIVKATAADGSGVYGTWPMMVYPTEQDVPSATPTYRALVVVEPTQTSYGLLKRKNDVDGMAAMLRMQRFDGQTINVKTMHQTSASQVLSAISSLASSANAADITYFYFLGHGDTNGTLIFYDGSRIAATDLKGALDKIPGRVVVFLGNCYSGYYVAGDSAANAISTADLTDDMEITSVPPSAFTSSIISVFSKSADEVSIPLAQGCSVVSANIGELRKSKYYVLTASLYNEQSWYSYYQNAGVIDESISFDRFTRGVCKAGGLDSVTKSATWSGSKKVTLAQVYAEAAAYVKSFTDHQSSVQVYPTNSSFVIFQH